MPSSHTVWLVSSPLSPSADAGEMLADLEGKLDPSLLEAGFSSREGMKNAARKAGSGKGVGSVSRVDWGEFKTGTLSSLLALADTLTKHDAVFGATTDKMVDTIRNLTTQDSPSAYTKHLLTEDGQPYLSPLTSESYDDNNSASSSSSGWSWNRAKYRVEGRALSDVVDALAKDMQSLDTIHKQKLSAYNIAKGQLAALQRKRTGNLATRDLSTVITKDQVPDLGSSEYLETVFVAVPKNNLKDFEARYERLTSMVVPRSANKIAQDDEFGLYTVTIFKKFKDEFAQKCREEKFAVREYNYDSAVVEKQKQELSELEASEKDLWTDLLRVSRINFAEAFSLIIHLKVVSSYVECVLRYGLPADYFICAITPDPKQAKRCLSTLSSYFKPFTPNIDQATARLVGGKKAKGKKQKAASSGSSLDENALVGEFQNLMEQEVFEFVLEEIPVSEEASNA